VGCVRGIIAVRLQKYRITGICIPAECSDGLTSLHNLDQTLVDYRQIGLIIHVTKSRCDYWMLNAWHLSGDVTVVSVADVTEPFDMIASWLDCANAVAIE